jgi:uncharacterized protein (TIGR03086 family)
MLNLAPATQALADLVAGVPVELLSAPTPCPEATLGDLLDHVDQFTTAFTAAAGKTARKEDGPPPKPDASRLGPDWRERITGKLTTLAEAWCTESAWTGMTHAGGLELPAEMAGVIALDEVVVHGWDIAVASGQGFACAPELLEAVHGFVETTVAQSPEGTPGLFGPPVAVPEPESATELDQLIALTGRDPAWTRPS